MNEKLRASLKKELAFDKEALDQGKWIPLGGNTDLEICVRPATLHNKDYQRKILSDRKYSEAFKRVESEKDALTDPVIKRTFAEVLYKTVIMDVRSKTIPKEEFGDLEVDDLEFMLSEYRSDLDMIMLYCTNRNNFSPIDQEAEKN